MSILRMREALFHAVPAMQPFLQCPQKVEVPIVFGDQFNPTHIMAVHTLNPTPLLEGQAVPPIYLVPVHDYVLRFNCANLPGLPTPSVLGPSDTTRVLPVVPIFVPVPSEFIRLLDFLYTKDYEALRTCIIATPAWDTQTVLNISGVIYSLWKNAYELKVIDACQRLFEVLDEAWMSATVLLQHPA
jgi:hypothetical protein